MKTEDVQTGSYIVTRARYGDFKMLGPVSRTTKMRVCHPSEWNTLRESYSEASDVLATGDEDAMALLCERLKSSAALKNEERKAATERHEERVEKLLRGSAESVAAQVVQPIRDEP